MSSQFKKTLFFISIFAAIFLFYFSPLLFNVFGSRTLGYWGDKIGVIARLEEGYVGFLNQPLLRLALMALQPFLSPFGSYNFLVLLSFPLACFFSYRFFCRFFDSFLAFALSLVFTFAPYHFYKSYNHLDLAQVWVFPLFFSALLDFDSEKSKANILKLAGVMAVTTLISNYYGYFTLLIIALHFVFSFVRESYVKDEDSVKTNANQRKLHANPREKGKPEADNGVRGAEGGLQITSYLLLVTSYLLFTVPFVLPYIRGVYFGDVGESVEVAKVSEGVAKRDVTDFVAFSARPRYYIVPSVDHPVFGNLAQSIHNWFESTGYFLFDDFFWEEHSAIFLGCINLLLAGYAVWIAFRLNRKKIGRITNYQLPIFNKRRNGEITSCQLPVTSYYIRLFFWLGVGIFILSLPPIISVSGFRIYLPSYLMMRAFPMFRTLSRLGLPLLLCVLILTGYGIKFLRQRLNLSGTSYLLLVTSYCFLALFEFYLPLEIKEVPPRDSSQYRGILEKGIRKSEKEIENNR